MKDIRILTLLLQLLVSSVKVLTKVKTPKFSVIKSRKEFKKY